MHNLSSIIDFFEKHGLTFKLRSDQRTAAEVKGNKMAIVSQVNYWEISTCMLQNIVRFVANYWFLKKKKNHISPNLFFIVRPLLCPWFCHKKCFYTNSKLRNSTFTTQLRHHALDPRDANMSLLCTCVNTWLWFGFDIFIWYEPKK